MLQKLRVRASAEAGNAMGNESSGENVILTWKRTVVEEVKRDEMTEEEAIDIPCLYPFLFPCRAHLSELEEEGVSVIEVGNAPVLYLALVRVHDLAEEAGAACHVDEGSCFFFHCLLGMDRVCLRSGRHPFVLL